MHLEKEMGKMFSNKKMHDVSVIASSEGIFVLFGNKKNTHYVIRSSNQIMFNILVTTGESPLKFIKGIFNSQVK